MAFAKTRDKDLFHGLKQKNKDAFIQAYDLHLGSIYRFIYFKTDNREEAEDLTSQTFLKVWDYIQYNDLDEYKSLKALLYKVARNTVIDNYRKKSNQQNISYENNFAHFDNIIDDKQDLGRQMDLSVDWKNLEKAMFELKDEYREIIILRYVNEFSITEIADILEKNKGTVRVAIFRALGALKELVKNQDGEKKPSV